MEWKATRKGRDIKVQTSAFMGVWRGEGVGKLEFK